MAGFENETLYATNGDFSGSPTPTPTILTDGQFWIGSTVLNAGGTHINVGTIISPLGTINVGYDGTNITLDVNGGGGSGGLVQQVRNKSTSAVSSTKLIAETGTTPTTSNMDIVISQTITPMSASNIIEVDFSAPVSNNLDGTVSFAIFNGSTFLAGFPLWINGSSSTATTRSATSTFKYYFTAGTTSPITIAIYFAQSQTGGTCRTLQNGQGNAFYTTGASTVLTLTEYN